MPHTPLQQFIEKLNASSFQYHCFYHENIINVVIADKDFDSVKEEDLKSSINDMEPPMEINHIILWKQSEYDKKIAV